MQKWNKVTSVEIDHHGVLNVYEDTVLVAAFGGKVWKHAITNGTSVYAIGARGNILQIDSLLNKVYFDKRVENAQTLEWSNGSIMVHKNDQTSDVFVDAKYTTTIYPPSATPTNTPTPTSTPASTVTPTPTPTPTFTPTSTVFDSVEQKLEIEDFLPIAIDEQSVTTETSSSISFIKQQKLAQLQIPATEVRSFKVSTDVAVPQSQAQDVPDKGSKSTPLQKLKGLFGFKWSK